MSNRAASFVEEWVRENAVKPVNVAAAGDNSALGWTVGAGVEIALWTNWSAKFEYLYVSANGANVTAPIPNTLGTGIATTPMEYRDNIVRVGVNYKFGPRGGPGVLETPLPAREAFAWNGDFLPTLQFATGRENQQVAATNRTKSPDNAQAMANVMQEMQDRFCDK